MKICILSIMSTILLLSCISTIKSNSTPDSSRVKPKVVESDIYFFNKNDPVVEVCMRGVVYYRNLEMNTKYFTPAFKPDGSLYTCSH